MTNIPKNECEGCASRDRIIDLLAKRIDELEADELLEIPREIDNVEELRQWMAAN